MADHLVVIGISLGAVALEYDPARRTLHQDSTANERDLAASRNGKRVDGQTGCRLGNELTWRGLLSGLRRLLGDSGCAGDDDAGQPGYSDANHFSGTSTEK